MVPRRPPASPEPTLTNPTPGKDKKEKGKGKKDKKGGSDAPMANDESVESPQPPMDPDDKLVFDAYMTAIGALEKIVSSAKELLTQYLISCQASTLTQNVTGPVRPVKGTP